MEVRAAEKPRIICVIGPTASGKSARAIALAKELGGEVISVDSRQVYRTLDIGTEKIIREEMQGIPHHLIDIREPEDSYSAGDFAEDAAKLIADMHERGVVPILAGGSHYYFDALIYGLPEETPTNTELRDVLELKSTPELFEELQRVDPRRASLIDQFNRRRLIRALEVADTLGHVPERATEPRYNVRWEVLLPSREILRAKIAARLKETLGRGLVDEVRRTRERVGDDRLKELGLEYRIVGDYLRGELAETALLPTLEAKLYQYAKRQEAWIRKLTR